jgi:hypothetical protein
LYTHVSIAKLKAIHAATHPGAKLQRNNTLLLADLGDAMDRHGDITGPEDLKPGEA